MAAYIQTLKDSEGNTVYLRTKNEAVYNSKGVPLSEQHFIIEGPITITDIETTITDNRIRANAVMHVYYNDSSYDIKPTYTVSKGSLTISIEEFPEDITEIIIDAIEVVNL